LTKIEVEKDLDEDSNIHIFHPNSERIYYLNNLLTIENENGIKTLRISQWLHEDPLSFDKTRREYKLQVSKEVFYLLVSKLRANHPEYFRDALGLNARIEFKGYDSPVKAIVLYKDYPVEFYKWWCLNQDSVNMTLSERIKLFNKVLMEGQNILKREHKKMINKE